MSEIEKPGSCPVFFVLGFGFGVTEALATWVPEVRLLRERIIFAAINCSGLPVLTQTLLDLGVG